MKKYILSTILVIMMSQNAGANPATKIIEMRGEVKVRRGLEEAWQNAGVGMILEDIDTILIMEHGEAVLEIGEGATFRLGRNSVLDIGDLRKMTERELFLFLVSEKIETIKPRKKRSLLHFPNVTVTHGLQSRENAASKTPKAEDDWWRKEMNGAKAMYQQEFYPNAVVKLHKMYKKYPQAEDCGEILLYLGKTLEALEKPGQAMDAYQNCIKRCKDQDCASDSVRIAAEDALESLKEKQ